MDIFKLYIRQNTGLVVVDALAALLAPGIELLLIPELFGALTEATPATVRRRVLAIAGAVAALQSMHVVRNCITTRMRASMDAFLKVHAVQHLLQRLPGCAGSSSGDIVFLLTTASELARVWIEWVNEHLLPYLAIAICGVVAFSRIDASLTAALLTVVVLVLLAVGICVDRCSGYAADHATQMTDVHKRFEDLVLNGIAVETCGTASREIVRLKEDTLPVVYDGYHRTFRCAHALAALLVPVFGVFVVVGLHRGIALLHAGGISHSQFVSIFFVLMALLNSVVWIGDNVGDCILDMGHARSMLATLFAPNDDARPAEPPATAPPDAQRYHLGLQNVTMQYKERPVFRDLSLHFERGRCTALTGGVGSGKSTILKVLLCFCQPSTGAAYIDGRWYAHAGARYVRQHVGIIPQVAVLFDNTVVYNVRYGNEDRYTEAQVHDYIVAHAGDVLGSRMGAANVGPGGQFLSGGQRQVVWCLRIFLWSPAVVLMDEPTAAMDAPCKAALLRLLAEARERGITAVIASHDPVLLGACSRVVVIPE